MRLTVLLADSAQAAEGKLYVLGGGWTDTPLTPDGHTIPHALAVLVHVPWDEATRPHQLTAKLRDVDGHQVEIGDEPEPVEFAMDFEVQQPPDAPAGTALPASFALNMGPLPLRPGRYSWDLCVDDSPLQQADVSFTVREGPPMTGDL